MGTSGAYGGSNTESWQRARGRFDDVLADDTGASIPALVRAIVQALINEDPSALNPADGEQEPLPDNQALPRLLTDP
jgi:hypothetical protein